MRYVLSKPVTVRLRRELERCLPHEACGFVLGCANAGGWSGTSIVPATNAFPGSGEFTITKPDAARASWLATARGLEIVGVYHSHPGGRLILSDLDRASAARSSLPWLIIARGKDSLLRVAAFCPQTLAQLQIVINGQGSPS